MGLCEKLVKSFGWSTFYSLDTATYPLDKVFLSLNDRAQKAPNNFQNLNFKIQNLQMLRTIAQKIQGA